MLCCAVPCSHQVKLDPRFVSGDTPPLSCRAVLLRLLNNLKQIYITLNMAEDALNIVRYGLRDVWWLLWHMMAAVAVPLSVHLAGPVSHKPSLKLFFPWVLVDWLISPAGVDTTPVQHKPAVLAA